MDCHIIYTQENIKLYQFGINLCYADDMVHLEMLDLSELMDLILTLDFQFSDRVCVM